MTERAGCEVGRFLLRSVAIARTKPVGRPTVRRYPLPVLGARCREPASLVPAISGIVRTQLFFCRHLDHRSGGGTLPAGRRGQDSGLRRAAGIIFGLNFPIIHDHPSVVRMSGTGSPSRPTQMTRHPVDRGQAVGRRVTGRTLLVIRPGSGHCPVMSSYRVCDGCRNPSSSEIGRTSATVDVHRKTACRRPEGISGKGWMPVPVHALAAPAVPARQRQRDPGRQNVCQSPDCSKAWAAR